MKILKIISILFIIIFFLPYISYEIFVHDDKDVCLDSGFCKEGLTLNTENGEIIVNKNTCEANGGIWKEKIKACKFSQKKY